MAELLEAVSYELTHDLRSTVTSITEVISDPRLRATFATRLFLHKARVDKSWAWSMINVSSNGFIFGAETFKNAYESVERGIAAGYYDLPDARIGRDLVLGTCLAAFKTITREEVPDDFPEKVTCRILISLGLEKVLAQEFVSRELPKVKNPT